MARRPKIRAHEINVPIAAISSPAAAINVPVAAINVPVAASASEPTNHRRASQGAVTSAFITRPLGTPPSSFFFRRLRGSQRPRRSRRQHRTPQLRFARMPMRTERDRDVIGRRFDHLMPWVGGELRPPHAHECPTRPRAPAALVTPRLVHPIGVVLKMYARIADEHVGRGVGHQPRHGCIRQRPVAEHRFITPEIGPERTVEAEDRARRQAALPEGVAVLQTIKIKSRPALPAPMRVQRPPIEPGARGR